MARYALVIGITQNQVPLQTLEKSAADAGAIAAMLRDFGDFQVEVLVKPEETTYKALEAKLLEFFNDRALRQEASIYYTGHGFQLKGTFGKKEAYLAPSDCVVELDVDGQVVKQQNGLSLTAVNALAADAELSNLVMLLDCCHSGYLLEESLLKQTFITFTRKDYWLMTACRSFQSAYARRKDLYSIFTGAVLKGLERSRANDRGEITVGGLFTFIAEALRGEKQEVMQLSVGRPIAIVRYPVAPQPVPAVVDETNPYQGLLAFTPETAKFFFGRETQIGQLAQRVGDCNFVPVIGASGNGKSSLVRAGLIPRLLELGWRVLPPLKPGSEPLVALKLAVGELFAAEEREEIYRILEQQGLGAITSRLPGTERVLLVVDQFEEVFTLCTLPEQRQQRQQFIDCLTSMKQSENRRLVVVTTMRADFVEPWLRSIELTAAIQNDALFLGALTGENLETAIEQPASIQGYKLQPGLLELILRDVAAEENSLPLLQFLLMQLWEKRDLANRELTVAEYANLGGLVGALDLHAESIYRELDSRTQGKWAQRVMLRLVRTGEEMRDIRQRRSKLELLEMGVDAATRGKIENTIDRLVDGRLLVSDRVNDENVVDLSHEALMQGWKRFVKWREIDRDLRRLVDKIEEARREWLVQKSKKDQNYYTLQGPMLKSAKDLLKNRPELLLSDARSFVVKSLKYRQKNGLGLIAIIVIPSLLFAISFEYLMREESVKQDYISIIDKDAFAEKKRYAVLNLAGGCWANNQYNWLPTYFRERAFGNCRSLKNVNLMNAELSNTDLSNANLVGANLVGANLRNTDLSNANLRNTDLSNFISISGCIPISSFPYICDGEKIDIRITNLSRAN